MTATSLSNQACRSEVMRAIAWQFVVFGTQAVAMVLLYWGRISDRGVLFRSDIVVFALPTLAAVNFLGT